MKSNHIPGFIFRSVLLVLFAAGLSGCDRSKNNPGWDYFPDMFYSTAYESYTKNPNFKDGMTMRLPAAGSVPRGFVPFEYTTDPSSRIKAGIELINPFPSSPEAISRGKKVYITFCVGCHGIGGDGDGKLYTSKLYPLKPRPLSTGNSVNLKDGEIYHSITLGFGSMGAHGAQIVPDDRWKLILYIRTLQEDAKKQITPKNEAQ
jgi:mono/diheme cytochrome c family protein